MFFFCAAKLTFTFEFVQREKHLGYPSIPWCVIFSVHYLLLGTSKLSYITYANLSLENQTPIKRKQQEKMSEQSFKFNKVKVIVIVKIFQT